MKLSDYDNFSSASLQLKVSKLWCVVHVCRAKFWVEIPSDIQLTWRHYCCPFWQGGGAGLQSGCGSAAQLWDQNLGQESHCLPGSHGALSLLSAWLEGREGGEKGRRDHMYWYQYNPSLPRITRATQDLLEITLDCFWLLVILQQIIISEHRNRRGNMHSSLIPRLRGRRQTLLFSHIAWVRGYMYLRLAADQTSLNCLPNTIYPKQLSSNSEGAWENGQPPLQVTSGQWAIGTQCSTFSPASSKGLALFLCGEQIWRRCQWQPWTAL